jgi:hypothetical protein
MTAPTEKFHARFRECHKIVRARFQALKVWKRGLGWKRQLRTGAQMSRGDRSEQVGKYVIAGRRLLWHRVAIRI